MVKKIFAIAAFAALMLCSGEAMACTVKATTPGLGTYATNQPVNNDSSGFVTVNCPGTTPYNIGLDNGLHYAAPYRRLQNGASFANYDLYKDASRTQKWGLALTEELVYGMGTGTDQTYSVFSRVFAVQSLPPGTYTDTVIVTVTY
ncbi:MAG: spore coat U domain-containing protein [Deltaproteobacteria bacterium]|nr:spore coat U domain-containing protein [Deltaproteobacteria bacterium]